MVHPAQLRMLGPKQPGLTSAPGCHDEHVIPGVSVFGRLRLLQDGDLLEHVRLDANLFLKFANEGIGRCFASFAVSTDDVPHTGVKLPVSRAPSQKDPASPHQPATSADPRGATRRPNTSPFYISHTRS